MECEDGPGMTNADAGWELRNRASFEDGVGFKTTRHVSDKTDSSRKWLGSAERTLSEGPGGACVSAGLRQGHRDPQEPKDERCPGMGCCYPRSGGAVSPRPCPPTHPQCHQRPRPGDGLHTRVEMARPSELQCPLRSHSRGALGACQTLPSAPPYGPVSSSQSCPHRFRSIRLRPTSPGRWTFRCLDLTKPTGCSPHAPLRSPRKRPTSRGTLQQHKQRLGPRRR